MMSEDKVIEAGVLKRGYQFLKRPILVGFIAGVLISLIRNFTDFELTEFAPVLTQFNGSEFTAFGLGVLMVIIGLVILPACLSMKLGTKTSMFSDEIDWEDQRKLYGLSAVGLLFWGLLVVGLALAEPLNAFGAPAYLAGLGVMLLALIAVCWVLLKEFDELMRDVNSAMSVYGFYATFLVGGIWSGLAHLGLVYTLAPLDWISLLTVFSFAGSIIANGKRGLLEN